MNTNLAAVAGAASAMTCGTSCSASPTSRWPATACSPGLVAITAPCAFVGANAAVLIGLLAGIIVCLGVLFNERVIKVDDPCGAISVHGYCGWFGAVSVGIFADGTYGAGWNGVGATSYLGTAGQGVTGLLHGDTSQFVCQLMGATLCAVWAFGATFVVFKIVNAVRSHAGAGRGRARRAGRAGVRHAGLSRGHGRGRGVTEWAASVGRLVELRPSAHGMPGRWLSRVLRWLLHPTRRWDGRSRVPAPDVAPPSVRGRRRGASVRVVSGRSVQVSAAMNAEHGMVRTHAHTMRPATPQRTAEAFVTEPTPTIAPVMVCVVETGMPRSVARKSVIGAAGLGAEAADRLQLGDAHPHRPHDAPAARQRAEAHRGVAREHDPERDVERRRRAARSRRAARR